jgi:hypothetical protein
VCARNPNLQTKYLTTTTTTGDTSSKQAINEYTRTITRDSFAEDLEQEKNYPTNDKRQQPEATTKLATDTPQQLTIVSFAEKGTPWRAEMTTTTHTF